MSQNDYLPATTTPDPDRDRLEDAPDHLSNRARELWIAIRDAHDLQDIAGQLLLTTALESWDRVRRAQEALAGDGEFIRDRFNVIKAHPAIAVEEKARSQFRDSMKALGLDLVPLAPRPGRQANGALGLMDENLEFDLQL